MSGYLGYNNNPNLPKADYRHQFTQHELDEFVKCSTDPIYFAKNYIKIISVDGGVVNFALWDFQEEMIKTYYENRFSIALAPRQCGKTQTTAAFLLHYPIIIMLVGIRR